MSDGSDPRRAAREDVRTGGHRIALEIGGWPAAKARVRARCLLDELGLRDRARNHPDQLSGGQQQRVAIARALALSPAVVLADEPTAALDAARSSEVMHLFRALARDHGAAVIVVTHDHRSLDAFDAVYEMEDGTIRQALRDAA